MKKFIFVSVFSWWFLWSGHDGLVVGPFQNQAQCSTYKAQLWGLTYPCWDDGRKNLSQDNHVLTPSEP